MWKSGTSLALLVAPVALILLINWQMSVIPIEAFSQEKTEAYKDGVGVLTAFSQTLITITLSTLAASGFLLFNQQTSATIFCGIMAIICFGMSILSIYFAARLGFWASYSVVAGYGDIQFLVRLFSFQAFSQLVAASAVGALAFRISLK